MSVTTPPPRSRSRKRPRVPVVAFRTWLDRIDWRQGQHVTMLGDTGSGKTLVASRLLARRDYVVAIVTKTRDSSIDRLKRQGYTVVHEWPPPEDADRVILHARLDQMDDRDHQRETVRDALHAIFAEGGWTIYADEGPYLTDELRLSRELSLIWQQGRSNGLSLVFAAQRPFAVPQLALSQPSHLIVWRTNDERDLKRLGEIAGGLDKRRVSAAVSSLVRHAFLHVDTAGGALTVSKMPLNNGSS